MAKKKQAAQSGPRVLFAASALKKALSFVSAAVNPNPIVPVLDNVKVYVKDDQATLTTSDLQQTMRIDVPCESFSIGADGELFLLPFDLFSKLVGQLGNQPMFVSIGRKDEAFAHRILTDQSTYKLVGEDPIDFPSGKNDNKGKAVNMILSGDDLADFHQGLISTGYSTTNDELRPATTAVCMRISNEGMKLASTNLMQLNRYIISSVNVESIEALLPKKFVLMLIKLIGEGVGDDLEITLTPLKAVVKMGNKTIEARLIDERFPDYENAIPVNNTLEMTVQKDEIVQAVNRVMLVANRTTLQIRLTWNVDVGLQIGAEDLDYSNEGIEVIPNYDYEGDPFEIGFNGKHLLSTLNHLQGDQIRFSFSTPNRAALLFGDNDQHTSVLMPALLNAYA
ncbi:DNA polymerase-3 subunit beta [Spirosoma lacussanchae]|uniref:DNA polymerase III subunit beta n=1 Tax=Spirosoma lacussanchae TaxID=1884249 RepID=UPI0011092ED6|nr:DNA polymerase III subunit beta [Spirosoma lacussanchae]